MGMWFANFYRGIMMEDLNIDYLEFSGFINTNVHLVIVDDGRRCIASINKEDAIKIIAHLQGVFEL